MLTDKLDLRGGRPLWRDSPGASVRTRSKLETETCDIAVVGGGVSGALIALTLTRAGFDVVVVDRRQPGLGSTAASTAMIQFELDTPLRELADKIGARRAAGLLIFFEIEDLPGCMAILGCGGNGISFSMIAAQVVEAWANGKRDPDAALFEESGK